MAAGWSGGLLERLSFLEAAGAVGGLAFGRVCRCRQKEAFGQTGSDPVWERFGASKKLSAA